MTVVEKLLDRVTEQFISARLLAFFAGLITVIWLGLAGILIQTSVASLLTLLFGVFFGVKSIEWIGKVIKSVKIDGSQGDVDETTKE
jgi:hypothetical protein